MKIVFLSFFIPLVLSAEINPPQEGVKESSLDASLDFPKMLSLTEEYFLGLTEKNEKFLYGPQAQLKEKATYLNWKKDHAFPWLSALALFAFSGLSWIFYLFRSDLWMRLKIKDQRSMPPISLKQSLKNICEKKLIEKERPEEFYCDINDVIYLFLAEKTNMPVNRMTIKEINQLILGFERFTLNQKQHLICILEALELIKFGNKVQSKDELNFFLNDINWLTNNFK